MQDLTPFFLCMSSEIVKGGKMPKTKKSCPFSGQAMRQPEMVEKLMSYQII